MNRRTFIKTAGLSFLLPQLESLGQTPSRPVKRLFTVVNHLGFYQPALLPDQADPVLLKNLDAHQDSLKIFSGFGNPGVQLGRGHTPCVGVLSGYFNTLRRKNRISFDQQAAEFLGRETRFNALAFQAGQNLNFSQVCWDRNGLPVHQMDSPERIFNLLFGVDENHAAQKRILAEEKSILDLAYKQAGSMSKNLSRRDREKVDEYFASVRDVEKSVRKRTIWNDKEKPKTDYTLPPFSSRSVEDYLQVMLDLSLLTLETDSTRVVTLQIPFWEDFSQDNIAGNYHLFSHHSRKEETVTDLLVMENMIMRKIGNTLTAMKQKSMTGGNSLFDETSTLVTASMGNASAHTFDDLPALYVNRSVKKFQHETQKDIPICNLYLSILQELGIEMDRFGESNATLTLS
ncbi:MAG: DUF1552 domain-containing protein [Fuerstiella sp.]|nr:DUF1552 domain-containing protein [Fuerstiella sp.]